MASTPGEQIVRLETQMADLKEQLTHTEARLSADIAEVKATMKTFIASADERYSSKWVEKAFWSIGGGLTLALVGLFIFLVESHMA